MKTILFRLKPGEDLKGGIEKVVAKNDIKAGFIVTCVGGLSQATVRMAGATPEKQDIQTLKEDFEIVSLTGTVSTNGSHLHMSFSDKDGKVYGGHLKAGTLVNPTAEIVIGIADDIMIQRIMDKETGFKELNISKI